MKKYRIIILLSIILNVIFVGIYANKLINNYIGKLKISEEYNQFVGYGKDVDFLLNLLSEQTSEEETTRYIFDIYNNLLDWDEQLTQLQQNKSLLSKINTVDLLPSFDEMIIRFRSIMYSQIKENKTWESEEFQLYKKAIHEFLENIPSEYSTSKSFTATFNKAVDEFNKIVPSN